MRTARATALVALAPPEAIELWADTERWAAFVEGFGHVVEVSPDWPAEGSKLVWQSTPGGRGRVTEKSLEHGPGVLRTRVFEEALTGEQVVSANSAAEDAGQAVVTVELSYELARGGPFQAIADFVFIRRALRDALERTLRRFSVEAEEEAGLR